MDEYSSEGWTTVDGSPSGLSFLPAMEVGSRSHVHVVFWLTYTRCSCEEPFMAFIVINCLAQVTIQKVGGVGVTHSAFVSFCFCTGDCVGV